MTDHQQQLEQLKQQLYAKIQVTQTQEPLSDGDLLKYSELPICQKHQILHHQIKQRSMDEKRARYSPATSEAHEQVAQSLKTAASRSNSKSTKGSEVKMAGRASGRIVVGSDGENSILCFSVEPGTGTSGTQKQFIDIEVSPEQLEDLGQSLQTYQELKDE